MCSRSTASGCASINQLGRRDRTYVGDDRIRAPQLRRGTQPVAPRSSRGSLLIASRRTRDSISTYSKTLSKTPQLLDSLLRPGAPSGYEGPAAAVWREAASFAELSTDGIGSSIARVGNASPLLAVVGHIDEIGLIVVHIDEKGFLWFAPVGGWDPQILVGQRVSLQAKNGPLLGVVGKKPIHLLDADQRGKAAKLKDLHIDIGAKDGDEAKGLVRIGDVAVIDAEPKEL